MDGRWGFKHITAGSRGSLFELGTQEDWVEVTLVTFILQYIFSEHQYKWNPRVKEHVAFG
jgi:hypothetical protein